VKFSFVSGKLLADKLFWDSNRSTYLASRHQGAVRLANCNAGHMGVIDHRICSTGRCAFLALDGRRLEPCHTPGKTDFSCASKGVDPRGVLGDSAKKDTPSSRTGPEPSPLPRRG